MQALDLLNDKLDTLLKKHVTLQSENIRLKDTVARQKQELDECEKQLASLQHGLVGVHLGTGVADGDEKDNMRKQLDLVLADIDKILVTLDD